MSKLLCVLTVLCFSQIVAYLSSRQSLGVSTSMYYKRSATDSPADEDNDKIFDEFFDKRINKPSDSLEAETGNKKKRKSPSFLYGLNRWEVLNRAVVAGVFVAGIGTGITIDSAINTNPDNLASRDAIDRNAPNPKLCLTYGYVSCYSLAYSLTHSLIQVFRNRA